MTEGVWGVCVAGQKDNLACNDILPVSDKLSKHRLRTTCVTAAVGLVCLNEGIKRVDTGEGEAANTYLNVAS